ncbi:MAG: threonine synthase, partial [bacterium]
MNYVSTRGAAPATKFEEVLETALAPDGGLYVPEVWPRLDGEEIARLAAVPYEQAAFRVLFAFVEGVIPESEFRALIEDAYAGFGEAGVAPVSPLAPGHWLLELFHGPTLAFKDVAMQLLARLLERGAAARR